MVLDFIYCSWEGHSGCIWKQLLDMPCWLPSSLSPSMFLLNNLVDNFSFDYKDIFHAVCDHKLWKQL
jgi:hypothetical protein